MRNKVDILTFGAHPDDVEISCSGTIMKAIDEGKTVAIVDLTEGELGSRGTAQTRYTEAEEASKMMKISERVNLKMKDGWFTINEENLRLVIEQIRHFRPEIVLCNAVSDRHPDHGRGGDLVTQACFLSGLLKIETEKDGEKQEKYRPRIVLRYIQDYYVEPDFVVDISEYVERKIEVIKSYKTQFYNPNSKEEETPISKEDFFDFLKGRMKEFGRPIGAEYAEGFSKTRLTGIKSLFDLL